MKILIGADLVPTQSNRELFAAGDAKALLGEQLMERLAQAQVRIFNLEVPLTDTPAPIHKCGPNLIAPTPCAAGYQAIGADILTLANNHILDQGVQGLESTLQCLKAQGIRSLGVGENPQAAAQPYVFPFAGKQIGIYACTEHEFSIVTENTPGANPFDPLESPDHVAALKARCDYVIVLYHGGKEHYRYPSPQLQKVCRKLVDKGADLVVCQHSHCIGCEEAYHGGTIVYGQGNFLFDHSTNECWQTGLLIQLNEQLDVSYLCVEKDGSRVKLAPEERSKQILEEFYHRSREISLEGFVERNYARYAQTMTQGYLLRVAGKRGFLTKLLNRLTGGRYLKLRLRRRYGKQARLSLQNTVECEAHRELLLAGIKEWNEKQ